MRLAVALLLVGTFLAGCHSPGEGTGEDFQRSCPSWFAAPDRPQSTIQFYHSADSESPEARQKEDRSRWVVHPGVGGGHFWRNGTTDYYLVDIDVFAEINGTRHSGVVDAVIRAEAYRSPWKEGERENPATPEGGEIPPPEHGRLMFIDMSDPSNPRTVSQIVVREGDILDKQYKIALTNGQGEADPWSLRIDWFFEGDQDGDPTTDAGAIIKMQAERWYRHNDCIS